MRREKAAEGGGAEERAREQRGGSDRGDTAGKGDSRKKWLCRVCEKKEAKKNTNT